MSFCFLAQNKLTVNKRTLSIQTTFACKHVPSERQEGLPLYTLTHSSAFFNAEGEKNSTSVLLNPFPT
jgi:hypothetical protein